MYSRCHTCRVRIENICYATLPSCGHRRQIPGLSLFFFQRYCWHLSNVCTLNPVSVWSFWTYLNMQHQIAGSECYNTTMEDLSLKINCCRVLTTQNFSYFFEILISYFSKATLMTFPACASSRLNNAYPLTAPRGVSTRTDVHMYRQWGQYCTQTPGVSGMPRHFRLFFF